MPEVVTLTYLTVFPTDERRLLVLSTEVKQRFERLPGCLSYTIWRDDDEEGKYLLIVHYDSVDASLHGYEAWGTSPQMFDLYAIFRSSPDVLRLVVDRREGTSIGETPWDGFLSVSTRNAELGLGGKLVEELGMIFVELANMEGYRGSMVGHQIQLAERVSGIVLWTDRTSFLASLPKKSMYEVRPFRRIL
ncbi:MAG: antibiotic biosynthesis monooxygenase [Fimbriimonadaceae bacterium]|nr:antibiotic biosynthesis monooxygenase [Fimbriimonadaceae bacterium]